MSEIDHIKKLIVNYTRRLQSLKEQQALNGLDTPPKILIEISDIEGEIARLQSELRMLEVDLPTDDKSPSEAHRVSLKETQIKSLRATDEKWKFISEITLTLHSKSQSSYRNVLMTLVDLIHLVMVKIHSYDDLSGVFVIILLRDENDDDLTITASRNLLTVDEGRKISGQKGFIGRALRTGEAVIANNIQENLSSIVSIDNCKSVICLPLKTGFIYYGAILVSNKQANFFNQEHAELLTHFCNHALVALTNSQRFEDLRRETTKTSKTATET